VVRDDLRGRPVHCGRAVALREPVRRQAVGAHCRGGERDRQIDRQCALRLVLRVGQIGERGRVACGTGRLRHAERGECLCGDDPGRDGGEEVFGEERAERLIFPGLDIARGPVVEQAEPADAIPRLRDRHRGAKRVVARDPDAEFELAIEPARRRVDGGWRVGRLELPARAGDRGARNAHRRGAPVIADRHVLVIGQQRIVGAEQFADRGGVVDADVEIGVVADAERQVQRAIGDRVQAGQHAQAHRVAGQQREERVAQGEPVGRGQGEQRVEHGFGQSRGHRLRQPGGKFGEIEHVIADRGADARCAAAGRKHPERQVLHREIGVRVGAGHPACRRRVVGMVDHAPGSGRAGSLCSHSAWRGARLVWFHSSSITGASWRSSAY
jgi:hypothetical protein